ncbi:uncharacterized protein LOC115919731 [Strongylocentrotus purpuratus]|uniref:Myb/SANT-like DNA-binding domain-containing protein n=1 Tax=Strongylocentrotus purpuratus TaxID=7668 RepID=A0A7M7N138_STRPU|nr:uncharacterized protein LOC115919731 [Strongylocentrotus purpuratus]
MVSSQDEAFSQVGSALSGFSRATFGGISGYDLQVKGGKPWEPHEVEALRSFVGSHASRLFGSGGRGSLQDERQKADAWEECRIAVMAAGGRSDRSWEKIRKKWQDLASEAKKSSYQRRQELHGTGGFVPPNEKVLQALPDELRDGITPIRSTETSNPDVMFKLASLHAESREHGDVQGEEAICHCIHHIKNLRD